MSEPQYHVAHLAQPGAVLASELERVFAASWAEIAHLRLSPGERLQRPLAGSEAMVFVLGGAGTVRLGELAEPLREGISLTLFQGEPLDLEAAADEGLDLFLAEINVDSQSKEEREP